MPHAQDAQLPLMILVYGLPGTGKSTFSRALARRLGMPRFNSDEMRQQLKLMNNYSPQAKTLVYEALRMAAEQELRKGQSVIIDANFTTAPQRQSFLELQKDLPVKIFSIRLTAETQLVRERLAQQRPDSKADWEVYQKLRSQAEYGGEDLLLESKNDNLENMLHQALSFINDSRRTS